MFCAEDGRFLSVRGTVVVTVPLSVGSLSAFQDDSGWFSLLLSRTQACARCASDRHWRLEPPPGHWLGAGQPLHGLLVAAAGAWSGSQWAVSPC